MLSARAQVSFGARRVTSKVVLPQTAAAGGCHAAGTRPQHAERRLRRPARFAQLRGASELLDVYRSGKDPAGAARLWQLTEQALGTPLPL